MPRCQSLMASLQPRRTLTASAGRSTTRPTWWSTPSITTLGDSLTGKLAQGSVGGAFVLDFAKGQSQSYERLESLLRRCRIHFDVILWREKCSILSIEGLRGVPGAGNRMGWHVLTWGAVCSSSMARCERGRGNTVACSCFVSLRLALYDALQSLQGDQVPSLCAPRLVDGHVHCWDDFILWQYQRSSSDRLTAMPYCLDNGMMEVLQVQQAPVSACALRSRLVGRALL